ncbi:hypothetical protein CC80DRAFT_405502 [Byssothecium circinans]|uniref:Uncharacterized protein n=1 Tax=Byssothecium circinans TaxID=147558 RepID=A0A6A5U3C4_9PLEO|nr:hypothetical protein CC80DRAFT_405502 [Byssothecium circinans]
MEHDDPHALGGNALADLENDTQADDFDRLMLQNAREEQRTSDARQGRVQAFRKARVHPRVGITLENLERHNAGNNGGQSVNATANAHVSFHSPPSSNDSARSDPAIQPPSGWGRKARVKRNWMRTITSGDEEQQQQTPVAQDTPDRYGADRPYPSVEDSPLSHKSSLQGTPAGPRQRQDDDWSFNLEDASVIASTPYIPRNTALDDIRQREIDSLREQAVTTNRLGQIRDTSPEETWRRPRSSSAKSTSSQSNGTAAVQYALQEAGSPERHRKRTNSWQTIGKSQAVTGEDMENSPVVVSKTSSETIGVVDHGNARVRAKRPSHGRDNSQDLLRRLARVSNTPSPGRTAPRPNTAPARQPGSSSQTMVSETSHTPSTNRDVAPTTGPIEEGGSNQTDATVPEVEPQMLQRGEALSSNQENRASSQDTQPENIDATPIPEESTILPPKTPIVTGAWIDTPRHATVLQPTAHRRSRSKSPQKRSPSKTSPQKQGSAPTEEEQTHTLPEAIRPHLPRSALEAVVEEARAHSNSQDRHDYGDSTINSLEELITTPLAGISPETEEDTLQGLQLPTQAPRNESERKRQEELLHLHRMNERLRAARTSIRDANRGIRRVENQVEHGEKDESGEVARVVLAECPCAVDGSHRTIWQSSKSLFYNKGSNDKKWGWGLTWLSILLLSLLAWFIAENIACEIWGHREYASSYSHYGIRWNAPQFPYVIPTMIYRHLIRLWWRPVWALLSFLWRTLMVCIFGSGFGSGSGSGGAETRTMESIAGATRTASRVAFEDVVLGMGADEVVR